jgi:hypothetical protein
VLATDADCLVLDCLVVAALVATPDMDVFVLTALVPTAFDVDVANVFVLASVNTFLVCVVLLCFKHSIFS